MYPGGKVEKNESLEVTLYRELAEETGIDLKDCIISRNMNR